VIRNNQVDARHKPELPALGSCVRAACDWELEFDESTPYMFYQGRWLFFCLPACLKTFLEDPDTSCLAGNCGESV